MALFSVHYRVNGAKHVDKIKAETPDAARRIVSDRLKPKVAMFDKIKAASEAPQPTLSVDAMAAKLAANSSLRIRR